jgi:hypothetical protein
MNNPTTRAAMILIGFVLTGALLMAGALGGRGDPQQDTGAIAKALAEKLHDELGFEAGTTVSGAAPAEKEKAVLYPLKVRGGGVPVTVSTIRRFKGGVVVYAHFSFKRGTKAAGPDGKGLGPGECAWVDRRLNADEPCELLFYGFDTKVLFTPDGKAGGPGYVISTEVRSNKPGKSHPWHKDFFQSFSDPSMVTEFWVTKSKDSKYLLCGLD